MEPFDESEGLKSLLSDVQIVLKGILPLSKLKPGQPNLQQALERAIKGLPDSATLAEAAEELRRKAQSLLAQITAGREEQFRRIEAEVVKGHRQRGEVCRELDTGWRIGSLEMEFSRPQAKVRFLYNKEPLTDSIGITSVVGLERAMANAEAKLKAGLLPLPGFALMLRDAYNHLKRQRAPRVSLRELYPELRLALMRGELRSGKPDRRLKFAEFPIWAYLHNLDVYRRDFGSLDRSVRLVFETGSQEDHAKARCVVLNGLDPSEPYKMYCWAYAESEG